MCRRLSNNFTPTIPLSQLISGLVRFPNSLGCELGERRSYSLWIELPGVFLPIFFIGRGKLGTELEPSTQNLGILISQTFKTSLSLAAERHLSLPPVCHFFGRPDIHAVFVFNKFCICEKLHFRFLPCTKAVEKCIKMHHKLSDHCYAWNWQNFQ